MKDIPAFPQPINPNEHGRGMTLRDYFAAKAMQGMMVNVEEPVCTYIAKQSYAMADAMMKERKA